MCCESSESSEPVLFSNTSNDDDDNTDTRGYSVRVSYGLQCDITVSSLGYVLYLDCCSSVMRSFYASPPITDFVCLVYHYSWLLDCYRRRCDDSAHVPAPGLISAASLACLESTSTVLRRVCPLLVNGVEKRRPSGTLVALHAHLSSLATTIGVEKLVSLLVRLASPSECDCDACGRASVLCESWPEKYLAATQSVSAFCEECTDYVVASRRAPAHSSEESTAADEYYVALQKLRHSRNAILRHLSRRVHMCSNLDGLNLN